VQAFTDENEHTGQSAPELAAALDALMQWVEKGVKPTPQSIAARCEPLRLTFEGPCRYHPEFTPQAYHTRYARGAATSAGAVVVRDVQASPPAVAKATP
jgi:hypothetical protein